MIWFGALLANIRAYPINGRPIGKGGIYATVKNILEVKRFGKYSILNVN